MNPSQPGRTAGYRLPIAICVIAAVLIGLVLLLSRGSDDPTVEEIVPPIATAQTGPTGIEGESVVDQTGEEIPATEGAIDGKGVTPAPPDPGVEVDQDHDHSDHEDEAPGNEASDIGPYVETATRFAELSLNRSTDATSSMGLDKKLVELSTGRLAADLENGTGGVQTAQVASTAAVLKAIPLVKEGGYAEVLVVAKQSIIDPATEVALDPKYLNYLVRLEKVGAGAFAVTSWEPQL